MSKGDNFERSVCRALSLWWTEGERDDVFWRNRTRITSDSPGALRQLGDLTATHTVGIPFIEVFNVELKTGYSKTKAGKKHKVIPWDLLDLIDGKGKIFLDFWEQTQTDAILSKRFPMLIFKRDYHNPVVVMRRTDMFILTGYQGPVPCVNLSVLNAYHKELDFGPLDLYPFDKFFNWLRPGTIKLMSVQKQMPKKRIVKRVDHASSANSGRVRQGD
jgi:hypothetical protein